MSVFPIMVQCAICAKQLPEVQNRYLTLKKRRRHKKAIIAIARMLFTAIYHILKKNEPHNPTIPNGRPSSVSPKGLC